MKFLCGKINRLCILIILAVFAATNSIVFADESRIEFILGSNDCGGKLFMQPPERHSSVRRQTV